MLLYNSHNKLLNNSNSKRILFLSDGRLFRSTHASSPGSPTLQKHYKVNCWFLAAGRMLRAGGSVSAFGYLKTSPTHFALTCTAPGTAGEWKPRGETTTSIGTTLHWINLWIQIKALMPIVLPVRFTYHALHVYIDCKGLIWTIKQLNHFALPVECTWKGNHAVVPPIFAMEVLWRL